MKLCFVVQRYGPEITGGAEAHARALARLLATRHEVEIVTTCALDYATWRNHYPAGETEVDGLRVTRFKVDRPRDEQQFALYSDMVFRDHHSEDDERTWIELNGPFSQGLVTALPTMAHVDLFAFYSFRYYTTFAGMHRVADRSILVPTAEDDPAVRLPIFRPLFASPRAILYLTPEERDLVQSVAGNAAVPNAVVGCGVDVDPTWRDVDVSDRFGLEGRYLLYVGRIHRAKGVDQLLDHYRRARLEAPGLPPLALAGPIQMTLEPDSFVRPLGVVTDAEKAALMASADIFIMPSPHESLSISVLEAWAMGRPVLANAACKVLEGQCIRSNGGLAYRGYSEFVPALLQLEADAAMRAALGRSGETYVRKEYGWDRVLDRCASLIESVTPPR
jgi:glycosyltransferase involved in cell wall biosynthesis